MICLLRHSDAGITWPLAEEVGKEALKSGADEYVTRPIDLNHPEATVLVDRTMRKR